MTGAVTDLLGDGDHDRGAMRQHHLVLGEVLGQGERDRHARLAVQMPGDHEAVGGQLGAGDQGDEITDLQTEADQVVPARHLAVDANLDVLPARGLGVDLVAERVAAGLERQDRAGDELLGIVDEDAHPCTRGESGREGADRNEFQPAVVLEPADHAADGVGVHHQRAVGGRRLPRQLGGQRPAPGQRERHAEVVEDVADHLHHRVRAPRRARGLQQRQQRVHHPRAVGLGHGRGLAHLVSFPVWESRSTYRVPDASGPGPGCSAARTPRPVRRSDRRARGSVARRARANSRSSGRRR